jgi:flagellar biosynthetic protein FliO
MEDPLQGVDGFGWMLLKTGIILTAVCVLAYLVIRFWLRRFVTPTTSGAGASRLRLVQRLSIEPRRSVQVVRAGTRVLLIGVTENEIRLLCELDAEEWTDVDTTVGPSAFKRRLREVLARPAPAPQSSADEPKEEELLP